MSEWRWKLGKWVASSQPDILQRFEEHITNDSKHVEGTMPGSRQTSSLDQNVVSQGSYRDHEKSKDQANIFRESAEDEVLIMQRLYLPESLAEFLSEIDVSFHNFLEFFIMMPFLWAFELNKLWTKDLIFEIGIFPSGERNGNSIENKVLMPIIKK